ncbi:NAD(+) diphosphatase [Bifidobacterium sp. ESL0763]|uniref:NAD(+) diphosphatase n=1 Tax=Bifidobacterium sp. ESL0763 TaxID=2983227 RepID=UPI0023F666D3|nr:NAD(+) diphosphatase [Bifidobacterium sp. ESL0763]MDF7663399.1 NAD(+) diphosphatase [Bifidobacterium sp. ESL0763]
MNASFSPLALTQALPFLPMARGDLDYRTERRGEPGLIGEVLADPAATVMLVRDGELAVPRGQGKRVDFENVDMRLASLPGQYVAKALSDSTVNGAASDEDMSDVDTARPVAMYLGETKGPDARGVVALDISGIGDEATDSSSSTLFARALQRFDWVSLNGFATHGSAREVGWAVTAVALAAWHRNQRHCPLCGAPVRSAMAGWAQRCSNTDCAHARRPLFPRIEPAVIVSIVDGSDRLLLQHNRAWKASTHYSVCAGFVEAGEGLEHACRREAREEVGVELGEVKYLGSQPWPFPASLMVAFKAQALGTKVDVDGEETTEARFFTREQFGQALASGEIVAPSRDTIARYMMEEWYGRKL